MQYSTQLATGQSDSKKNNIDQFLTAVNAIFGFFQIAYPRKFESIWKTEAEVLASKREWYRAFKQANLTPERMKAGIRATRSKEWPPDNPAEFLKLCVLQPEDYDAPSFEKAFSEYKKNNYIYNTAPEWSHKAIYHAGARIGRSASEDTKNGFERFKSAYLEVLEQLERLPETPTAELPKPIEKKKPEEVAVFFKELRAKIGK